MAYFQFYDYGRQKFLMYYLSCRQLKRHDAVGDCSYLPYTWMKPATDERNDSATGNVCRLNFFPFSILAAKYYNPTHY